MRLMEALRIYRIDAFTTERGHGNPAGVVTNAVGLDESEMQAIAHELGHSETAFVLPAQDASHHVHVRFFTPATEVPVCGHATVAAHYALALEGGPMGIRRQLTGAGIQTVETRWCNDDFAIRIQQNRPTFAEPLAEELVDELLVALSLENDDLDPRCPPQFVSTGHGKLLVAITRRDRLRQLEPDLAHLVELGASVGSNGYFVFTLDVEEGDDALTHGRMFAPAIGVDEDPVTGNANGPLGAYLVRHGLLEATNGVARFRGRQQAGNGRRGYVDVSVKVENGEPVGVTIEGRAVLADSIERARG